MIPGRKKLHRVALTSIWGLACVFFACQHVGKKYTVAHQSTCANHKHEYKNVAFDDLIDSLNYYDGKYIRVTGKYKCGFEQSALGAGGLFSNEDNNVWVSFDLQCPLNLNGVGIELLDRCNVISEKKIEIAGKVNLKDKGHLSQYKASVSEITSVTVF